MGLMQKAIETYDSMQALIGVEKENEEPLAPIGHIIARAQIEITIDQDGRFIQARSLDPKNDPKIVIPVTEDSSGRTSAPAAHALCDQLGYLLPGSAKNELFVLGLQSWNESEYSNPKLAAVLKYVQAGTIEEDLKQADLLKYEDDGSIKNEKDMVCWIVHGLGDNSGPVWNDRELLAAYEKYYRSTRSGEAPILCMLTGNQTIRAKQHLKGVFSLNGNAKIISANDSVNFTYRGRFVTDDEAVTVGYDASQKAHNALKWLMANQGVVRGGRGFICWNPHGMKVAQPLQALFNTQKDEAPTPSQYREQLRRAIDGYKTELPAGEDVVIVAFDAATSGRLAVTYYAEMQGADFIDRLAAWDLSCCWYDLRFGTYSPNLRNIINLAFGTQRGSDETAEIRADDKILGMQTERLLACKLNDAKFPQDIMRAIVNKAGNLQIYTIKNRRNILFTACAVIRKYHMDYFKEEIDMALEPHRKDRSYQFGRLLAVMEKIERDTYDADESRETNAVRMQSIFVQRPGYAAKIVMDQLKNGYYPRLRVGQRIYYDRLIGEIMEEIDAFGPDEYNKALSETYLPGYYLQKNALYAKKNENNEMEENEDEV